MRVIIAGGRDYRMDALDWRRLDAVHAGDASYFGCQAVPLGPITVVYEGEAKGADIGGREWARSRRIPFVPFAANWLRDGSLVVGRASGALLIEQPGTGPAELVVLFPGHEDTKDMHEQADAAGVPVLDLSAPRAQRWRADHIADLNAIASHMYDAQDVDADRMKRPRTVGRDATHIIDTSRRAAVRATCVAHGGLGIPCASAHLFRVPGSRDQIILPPGSLYCGRAGIVGLRNLSMPADGDGSILGNPVAYKGGLTEEDGAAAMKLYRAHLRDLYRADEKVRALLDRIALGATLLVCWCHDSKPCHTTVIAEAAMLARATLETKAAGLPLPPKDLPISARSTASSPSVSGALFAGVVSS